MMPRLGEDFLNLFVALYTLRLVWNHGHHRESLAIGAAAVVLQALQHLAASRRKP